LDRSTATLHDEWNPSADGVMQALAASGGQVFVGGSFTSLIGTPRMALGAISAVDTIFHDAFE
jgi:hypothetical protein